MQAEVRQQSEDRHDEVLEPVESVVLPEGHDRTMQVSM